MRFFSFLLPLVLLLTIHLASADAQNSPIGNWTSPTINKNTSEYCCIPDSIEIISNGTDRYLAKFKSPSLLERGFDMKCFSLFLSVTGTGNMTLYQSDTDPDTYYSQRSLFGNVVYDFQVQSGPVLNVFIDSLYESDQCNFTMDIKIGEAADGTGLVFVIFFVILFFAFALWKAFQKKQTNVLVHQNIARPAFNYYPAPQHYYVAPPAITQPGLNTTNNIPVAPANAKTDLKENPEEQFLQDYPKFI